MFILERACTISRWHRGHVVPDIKLSIRLHMRRMLLLLHRQDAVCAGSMLRWLTPQARACARALHMHAAETSATGSTADISTLSNSGGRSCFISQSDWRPGIQMSKI